jgi:hypothetical protein
MKRRREQREERGHNDFTEHRRALTKQLLPRINHAVAGAAQRAKEHREKLSAKLQLQLEQATTAAPVAVTLHQQLLKLLEGLSVDQNALTQEDCQALHHVASCLGQLIDELSTQMRPDEGIPTLPAMAQSLVAVEQLLLQCGSWMPWQV